jgi:hypothetical protein
VWWSHIGRALSAMCQGGWVAMVEGDRVELRKNGKVLCHDDKP